MCLLCTVKPSIENPLIIRLKLPLVLLFESTYLLSMAVKL